MHIIYKSSGTLEIDGARITYRNFEGRGDKFNRDGDRNFVIVIPNQELADELIERGWNVKIKPPKDEGDQPFMFIKVKVNYDPVKGRVPAVYLKSGRSLNRLTEDTVGMLDHIDIESVDLDIDPYDWSMPSGKSGRSAYLRSIHVTQRVDRFAERYASEE